MKNFLSILLAGFAGLLVSCNNGTKADQSGQPVAAVDSAALKNLESAHLINQAFESGDFSRVKALIAPDAVDHVGPNGDLHGPDSIVANMQEYAKMATGMKSSTIREFADKDYVLQWMNMSGTMAVDAFGMKSGTPYEMQVVEVTRYNAANLAVEHWEFVTMADAMKWLGGAK